MQLRYFLLSSPSWTRAWTSWTTLNFPNSIMFCAKFGWNGPSGSGDDVLNFVRNLQYCLSLLGKGRDLLFESFESSLNPLYPMMPRDKFCWNWFLRRRFYLFKVFTLFCYYSHHGKGMTFHLNKKNEFPYSRIWLNMANWFWRAIWKC